MTLTVENLACARGGIRVIEGLNFALEPGHCLLLRGPNGVGKTTVLRTLAGLQPADEGTVSAQEAAMAYAGHADGIKAALTVEENLRFWASVYGHQADDAVFERFGLLGLRTRPAQKLSAGQKRRLALARLCVTGRDIWLLDEPTVSLDTDGVRRFADALNTHLGGGGMALVATHIDIGIDAQTLELAPFKAKAPSPGVFE